MTKKETINIEDYIIFRNDDFLAINKPPYISTLHERQEGAGTSILQMVKAAFPDGQMCHRLDKETSGVILVALNPAAYRHASMAFEHREVTKVYHAVVNGIHDLKGVQVVLPLLSLPNGIVKIDKTEGKEAETIFNSIEVYRNATLVECYPITGRMHQIRVHLSYLKAPIVADHTYGGKDLYLSKIKKKFNLKKDTEEEPLIKRVALHAYALNIPLLNGERQMIEAPYPKDMKALITQLEKNK